MQEINYKDMKFNPFNLSGGEWLLMPLIAFAVLGVTLLMPGAQWTPDNDMLMYFRQKGGSVIVPAIMHGTFNAVVPLSAIVVTPANDLLYGPAGLAGFIVLLILDIFLYLYDKYISKEKIFQKAME